MTDDTVIRTSNPKVCPYCGQLAPEDQIERPVDYCHHDVLLVRAPL